MDSFLGLFSISGNFELWNYPLCITSHFIDAGSSCQAKISWYWSRVSWFCANCKSPDPQGTDSYDLWLCSYFSVQIKFLKSEKGYKIWQCPSCLRNTRVHLQLYRSPDGDSSRAANYLLCHWRGSLRLSVGSWFSRVIPNFTPTPTNFFKNSNFSLYSHCHARSPSRYCHKLGSKSANWNHHWFWSKKHLH